MSNTTLQSSGISMLWQQRKIWLCRLGSCTLVMYEFLNQLAVKSRFRSLTVLLPVSVPCHQIIELSRAVEEARIAKGNTDLLILCSAAINLILISLPLEISMSGQTNSTLYGQNCSWAEPSSRCGAGCYHYTALTGRSWPKAPFTRLGLRLPYLLQPLLTLAAKN